MASSEPNIKNQHYVWRHYLNAWAVEGTFCCYLQKKNMLFPTQPKAIANEHYYYEIQRLTDADRKYLEAFISKVPNEHLRELNLGYIKMTQHSFMLRERLASSNLISTERVSLENELQWVERNLIERYHSGIENRCQDILNALRNEDDTFYHDEVRCIHFLHFLVHQYFRTPKMRERISNIPSYMSGHDPRRTAAILNHILATNVGLGLFRERNTYQIVFLRNSTSIPFVAGDQPVINMLDPLSTDDLELYYPLAPRLAIVLTKDTGKFPNRTHDVSRFEVEPYNFAIYRKSEDQIYSNDEAYLRSLVSVRKDLLGG